MDGVAERIETGQNVERNGGVGMPGVGSRDGDKLSPRARAIDADALSVGAKVPAASQTIAAMSAGDVTFANDEVAFRETFHVITNKIDDPMRVPAGSSLLVPPRLDAAALR